MVYFLSVRCLNCNNVDEFPRMDYDEIPYCSQCASTSNLVPNSPPKEVQQQQPWTADDDLANMLSRNLSLADSAQDVPPTPPLASPTSANFSISQHYNHSAYRPPTPQQRQQQQQQSAVDTQLMSEVRGVHSTNQLQDPAYLNYLLQSDLGSSSSLNELQIAVAHGLVSPQAYAEAVDNYTRLRAQQQQHEQAQQQEAVRQQLFMEMEYQQGQQQQQQQQHRPWEASAIFQQQQQHVTPQARGLTEDCSAHSFISATSSQQQQKQEPMSRTADYFNDYYGGVDQSFMDDEEAPCSVYNYAAGSGCRLQPFDL